MLAERIPQMVVIPLGRSRALRLSAEQIALALVLGIGALLRFVALGRWSLWTDELASLNLARASKSTILGHVGEPYPPLYHLSLHYWLKFGQNEFWLRLPSALAGFLSVWMVWKVGQALGNPEVGLLAAALLALSPIDVWYSREARMYEPATFTGLASVHFYVRILRRDNWTDGLGLATSMLAGIYTAYSTFALWLGEILLFVPLWCTAGRHRRRVVSWLTAQALMALGFAPWWLSLKNQIRNPNGGQLGLQIMRLLARFGFTGSFEQVIGFTLRIGSGMLLVAFCVSLIIAWRPGLLKGARRWAFGGAVGMVIAFVILTVLGAIPRGLSLRRQLLVLWPLVVLLSARAIIWLQRRRVAAGVIVLSLGLALGTAFGSPYQDWRGAAAFVAQNAGPSDVVLLDPRWTTKAFDYYYRGTVPYTGVDRSYLTDREEALLKPGTRVWLVLSHDRLYSTGEVEAWFNTQFQAETLRSFGRIKIKKYQASRGMNQTPCNVAKHLISLRRRQTMHERLKERFLTISPLVGSRLSRELD